MATVSSVLNAAQISELAILYNASPRSTDSEPRRNVGRISGAFHSLRNPPMRTRRCIEHLAFGRRITRRNGRSKAFSGTSGRR